MLINDNTSPSVLPTSLTRAGGRPVRQPGPTTGSPAFVQALNQARQAGGAEPAILRTIDRGDTLIGLVREQATAQGLTLKPGQEMRLAQRVASDNGIQNANLIFTGEKISLAGLQPELQAIQRGAASRAIAGAAAAPTTAASFDASWVSSSHPVLDKTLERAVSKGFIPVTEKAAVYDKILQLANTHRFEPDDFARMTLMESDGMNPRASNQRCHGIIQFCDGPARGAATAGYAANPRAILDLSVNKQLDLVGKYFEEVGLKNQGPAGLEDLYLSVLRPAARSEARLTANLNIPGTQSRYLYEGGNTSAPITRQSIRQGLVQNAMERLGQVLAPALRLQAIRAAKYDDSQLK